MDFGVVGLDSLVCPNSAYTATNNGFNSENTGEAAKHNWCGSDFLKQEGTLNEVDLRDLKVAKTLFCGQEMLKIPLQRSNRSSNLTEGPQMLSFSSPNSQNVTFPYYCHTSSSPFSRNTGNVSGGLNASSMHGLPTGTVAPFTPSQWMELEHQALIYEYIAANVPIPSYLLNPIRKAIEYAGFYSLSCLKSNSLEWNAFHLRFSNTDPEPGRCRRTDGKKWRCSKDAVADQKYCERHMNRGRHRSRKPVEGQPGHSASTITTTNGKLTPVTSPTISSVVAAGSVSNSHLSGMPNINRSFPDKEKTDKAYQNIAGLSSKINLEDNQYSIPKNQTAYEESSQPEFGFLCFDSLLNPLNRSSSFVNCRNFNISNHPNDHENKSQHSFRLFTDEWPKNQPENSAISCPNSNLQPDRTQLSISIPMVASNFMSSPSSPMNEKASLLRLSREHKLTQVGIGVGSVAREHRYRQTNGVPISWERSIGGPLAEVLHPKNNNTSDCKNTKALHLMESWDNSHQMASSPTGVLQMSACGSVTSSSTCSSPRGKSSKSLNGISLCNNGPKNPSLRAL